MTKCGSAPDCWLGLWLLYVCCILQLMLTWGVIIAWLRARLHINQTTCTCKAWLDMIHYIKSHSMVNHNRKARHKVNPQVSDEERYTHTVYNHRKVVSRWERKNCEQPILSATWHMLGNILYCFEYLTYQIQNVLWEIQ